MFSRFFGWDKEVRILILGLDGAGKTTILYRCMGALCVCLQQKTDSHSSAQIPVWRGGLHSAQYAPRPLFCRRIDHSCIPLCWWLWLVLGGLHPQRSVSTWRPSRTRTSHSRCGTLVARPPFGRLPSLSRRFGYTDDNLNTTGRTGGATMKMPLRSFMSSIVRTRNDWASPRMN